VTGVQTCALPISAGFLHDDDGIEYACQCFEGSEWQDKEGTSQKGNRYEYRANVNHAIGVLKDRLVGILIADDLLTRKYVYRELVSGIKRRIVPIRPNREVSRKKYLKKPRFHHNHKSNC
jgi:hypothetical protein